MAMGVDRMREISDGAEQAAGCLVPGMKFLGAFAEADKWGVRDDRERSLFTTIFLCSLPAHKAIVADNNSNFLRFE